MKNLLLLAGLALWLLRRRNLQKQSSIVNVIPSSDSNPSEVSKLLKSEGLPAASYAEVRSLVENINHLYADGRQNVKDIVGTYVPSHNAAQGSCMASVAQALCLNTVDKIPATRDNLKTLTIALLCFEGKSAGEEDFDAAYAEINNLFNQ